MVRQLNKDEFRELENRIKRAQAAVYDVKVFLEGAGGMTRQERRHLLTARQEMDMVEQNRRRIHAMPSRSMIRYRTMKRNRQS